jgi:hypothetical protein
MPDSVDSVMNYVARNGIRPRFYANDHSRDVLTIDARPVTIVDGRSEPPRLDREGFQLLRHKSAVADFSDLAGSGDLHRREIAALVQEITGADHVAVTSPGVLRFSEKSDLAGKLNNSFPARFAHVDVSDPTGAAFAERSKPEGREIARFAHFNVWRAVSAPPQDVPLALCDARSVAPEDLMPSDAIFDEPGGSEWSFEGLTVAHNPAHRWVYFSDMDRGDAIIFITNDSDPARPHNVPHCAFNNPLCPEDAPPRASIEMRATAYWYA